MQVWKRLDQGLPDADWRSVMKDLQLNFPWFYDQVQPLLRVLVATCVYVYVISALVGASSKW